MKRLSRAWRRFELLRHAYRDAFGVKRSVKATEWHLREVMEWLVRAQDATAVGGVAFGYSLHPRRGWSAAYPEITGYIIPTFYNYADHSGETGYRQRALRMARWEVEVQMANGAVQALTLGNPPIAAVFNTGQVLFGWTRAFRESGDEQFRDAAIRAAEFLVQAQDGDGAWRRHASPYVRPGVNVYDARTAWGLLEVSRIACPERYREAALRNLDFVLTRQHDNGWFADCCLRDDKRPLLHTIAYTMEGLLEAGLLLNESRYIEAAAAAAGALIARQRTDGSLAGRFDASWSPAADWSCLAGDAQTAVVWFRLFQATGSRRYHEAGRRIARFLKATQDTSHRNLAVRGAIKGSHPIWGEYLPFHYPSWAANFFASALMLELACETRSSEAPSRLLQENTRTSACTSGKPAKRRTAQNAARLCRAAARPTDVEKDRIRMFVGSGNGWSEHHDVPLVRAHARGRAGRRVRQYHQR